MTIQEYEEQIKSLIVQAACDSTIDDVELSLMFDRIEDEIEGQRNFLED
jgi:hypothetical protein